MIIIRYVAEAPLTAVTDNYRSNSGSSEFTMIVSQLRSDVASSLEFKAPHSNGEIDGLLKSIQNVDTRLVQMENSKGVYVVNRDINPVIVLPSIMTAHLRRCGTLDVAASSTLRAATSDRCRPRRIGNSSARTVFLRNSGQPRQQP